MKRLVLGALLVGAACSQPSRPPEPAPVVARAAPLAPATPPIRYTARAAAMINKIRVDEGLETKLALRLQVVTHADGASPEYNVFFDEPTAADQQFESDGVRTIVDPKSLEYLVGSEVDFLETAKGAGFKFNNPNER